MDLDAETEAALHWYGRQFFDVRSLHILDWPPAPTRVCLGLGGRVRQAVTLCEYAALADEMARDKFVFGLHHEFTRTELLKSHKKGDANKQLSDVVAEAKAMETARQANKLINESRSIDESGNYSQQRRNPVSQRGSQPQHRKRHTDMKLRRQPGTCFWCGDTRGPHPWQDCPAKGKSCVKCKGNDRVCVFRDGVARISTKTKPSSAV